MDQETPRFHCATCNKVRKSAPNFAQNTPEEPSDIWISLVGAVGIWIEFAGTWIKLDGIWIKLAGAWIKLYGDWTKLSGKICRSTNFHKAV